MGPVHVELHADEGVGVGEFLVASEIVEAPGGAAVGSLSLPTDAGWSWARSR